MSSSVLAFATIFLGLIVGPQPVEVRVDGRVETVALELDGRRVAELDGPSWRGTVDFGQRLEPHRLEAIAYDAEDAELARAVQWINLPKPGAEVELMIERDEDGRSHAGLTWANVSGYQPQTIRVEFDGREIPVTDPDRIPLPPHDPERLHFLRVEIEFPDNVSAVEELTFGGSYGERVDTQLTAIPVRLERGAELPDPNELATYFTVDGRPTRVAAVDEGPAEIVLVRDRAVQPALEQLVGRRGAQSNYWGRFEGRLRLDQKLGFFWPFLVRSASGRWTFPATYGWMSARDGGVGWFLARVPPPRTPPEGQMLTDAVAVAGLNALARNRRRAVVLVLGPAPEDASRLLPAEARRYLGLLRVPLFVWSPHEHPASPWGEVTDISTGTDLLRAIGELSDAVDRQRIVWIEGRHLPQRIELSHRAVDLELAL